MEQINQLLEMSPPVLLALALNGVGFALKKSPMPGWLLPLALMVLGGAAYPFIADATKVSYTVNNPAVFNVVIGVAIGGFSVGLNQLFRQFAGKFMEGQE